ncbi:MAG: FprA family A-type flavoprotein [Candidatus Cloacimonetes bacterium]|nr:FprA family A-type flavoprotein [Candidatus Cloacimonadota bacterium]
MLPIEIKKNVYWVGGIDWDLRNFHGYLTQRGSSYNAYLITGEKNILIDNVKIHLYDQLLARIAKIIDPTKIDYFIQNHVEMDHSGALPKLIKLNPGALVITSPNGEKGLKLHFKSDWNFRVVQNNEKIKIGEREFQFVLTPMVHWPDNMVTYSIEDKILFSNDAFGQHISSSERFVTEYPLDIVFEEAKKYYANIVLPYGEQVKKVLPVVESIEPDIIAPSHGLIWNEYIPKIITEYRKWSNNETENKAVIIYDTMWKSTELISYTILRGFEHSKIPVEIFNLQLNHISDIMTSLIDAKYICIGSSTLNNGILPSVAAFLTYLKGLAPKNRTALAFGSYGWGGQSVPIIEDTLTAMKFDILPSIKEQYIPSQERLDLITDNLINLLSQKPYKVE